MGRVALDLGVSLLVRPSQAGGSTCVNNRDDMHWCFSAADGLIISMAQRPLPKHLHLKRMKFPVLCQGLT